MKSLLIRFNFPIVAVLLLLALQRPSLGGSATWSNNPSSDDWNTATNWVPNTVPNSITDMATFDASQVTNVVVDFGSNIDVASVVFNSGAPSYTIILDVSNLKPNGAGFVSNSGLMQSVIIPEEGGLAGAMFFNNSASAGNMTSYSGVGGLLVFYDSSSAGAVTFDLTSGSLQADMQFRDDSTAPPWTWWARRRAA